MSSTDRGYTILLSHLHSPTSKLPLSTIQGALAHHLATSSPLPTPLAATAITSPFYLSQPFTYEKLQSFSTAFRHASHLKYRALVDTAKTRSRVQALLGRSLQAAMGQWVLDVLQGVHGGHPVLRLASCSGLLLGVEDLKVAEKGEKHEGIDVGTARFAVEDENVVALAEVMDTYAYGFTSGSSSIGVEEWEKEFQPAGQDILSLALIFASQSLPLVTQSKVKALPLPILARLLTTTISSTFKAGTFLSSVSASVTLSPQHQVHISGTSPLAQTLKALSSSPLTVSIPSISRLTANVLALLIEDPSSSHLNEGMSTILETLEILRDISKQVERDWISCPLASVADADIAPDSKDITKSIWTTLKTLLFSNIMLAEAVLSASVYLPPESSLVTPASLAVQILQVLSHLSFVISEFGGVTTTTQGFEHLKKTFYLALDVLAQGDGPHGDAGLKAEAYIQQACFGLNSQRVETAAVSPRQAKQAFVLASIEQLVPVLSDKCIRDWVWGICYPHLFDPSHRETYESAHSVILAIFAAHAQRQQQYLTGALPSDSQNETSQITSRNPVTTITSRSKYRNDQSCIPTRVLAGVLNPNNDKIAGPEGEVAAKSPINGKETDLSAAFVKMMVPFYSKCLIDNSADGRLNTSQLRLAYAALVRSASVSAFTMPSTTTSGASDDTYTLAWYCIQMLLDTIHALQPPAPGPKGKQKARDDDEKTAERVHRLHLMLISTVSSLPLPLMLRALDKIRSLITAYPADDRGVNVNAPADEVKGTKAELLQALFHELLEKTGDREKEAAIQWWYKYRTSLIGVPAVAEEKEGQGLARLGGWFRGLKGPEKERPIQAMKTAGEENQTDQPILSRL